jgi:iron complex outermembrane receptor protein
MKPTKHPVHCVFALATLIVLPLLSAIASAQTANTGTLEGRVSNSVAGSYLKQVRVTVEGTALETFTNEAGEFRISGVPAGEVAVRASVAGLGQQSARVRLAAGQVARQDFDLGARDAGPAPAASMRDQTVVLDAFTVAERELSAQSAALQEQRTAPNIKNVIAFEEFGDLGDGNPGEFLKFVPGIQVAMSPAVPGNASIRGMPSSGTLLTIDGVELSSDAPQGRGAGFTASNTANIDRIEITKVPTPDMPANAVGGMINVVSKSGFSRRVPQFTYSVYGLLTTMEPLGKLGRELFESGSADSSTGGPRFRPGFDFTYIKPINASLAVSISGGHNTRWEDKDNLVPTWNRVTLVQTQSQNAAQISTRERNAGSVRIDWKPGRAHSLFGNFQYTSDDVSSRIYTQTQAYGTGATGGENFTQGAATGVGTATLASTYREQLKETGHLALGYRFDDRGWKLEATIAFSQSSRRTLSAEDGHDYFGTTSATIPNLVLRGEGFAGVTDGAPPVVTGVNRSGQPVDINNGRLFSLNSATSPTEPLMTNRLATLKLNASRDLGLPDSRAPHGRHRCLAQRTRHPGRDPHLEFPPHVGRRQSRAACRQLRSHQRDVFRSSARSPTASASWIDPRKVYGFYKAQPSYFVLNESAYHISRVNGSQELEETVSAGFLRTDLKLFDNRLWLVAGARYERTDNEGTGALNDIRATYQQDAQRQLDPQRRRPARSASPPTRSPSPGSNTGSAAFAGKKDYGDSLSECQRELLVHRKLRRPRRVRRAPSAGPTSASSFPRAPWPIRRRGEQPRHQCDQRRPPALDGGQLRPQSRILQREGRDAWP